MQDRSLFPSLEARERFGQTLTAWANRNGWIHSTLHEWGAEAGFPAVRDSSFNKLQNAKTEQPAPLTFIQLAIANSRVAANDYSGIQNRQLKDRLVGSIPICTPDDKPWGAMEFFGHFVGELEAPEWVKYPRLLSDKEAKEISEAHRKSFNTIASRKKISLSIAWRDLEPYCDRLSKAQKTLFRDVLSGWHEWTAKELNEMTLNGDDPIEAAFEAWIKAVGKPTKH